MATPTILIEQEGASPGTPGANRTNPQGNPELVSGTEVRCSDPANPDGQSFVWEMERPSGSTAEMQNHLGPEMRFIPDVPGRYRIFLTVDGEQSFSLEGQQKVSNQGVLDTVPGRGLSSGIPRFIQVQSFDEEDLPDPSLVPIGTPVWNNQKQGYNYSNGTDKWLDAPEQVSPFVTTSLELMEIDNSMRNSALSGDLVQVLLDPSVDISAADLNAAPAGTLKRKFFAELRRGSGSRHRWANIAMLNAPGANDGTFVTGESVVDADVGAPTVSDTAYVDGRLSVEVTFDTDAGSTKTYAAADSVTVEVKISASDSLLGHTVASVTQTYNVV